MSKFLEREGVQPWTELPLWIPSHDASMRGFHLVDTKRAQGKRAQHAAAGGDV